MKKNKSERKTKTVAIVVPFRDPENGGESAEAAKKRAEKRKTKWTHQNIHEFTSKSRTEQLHVFLEYMSEDFLPYVSEQYSASLGDSAKTDQEEEEKEKEHLQFVILVIEQSKSDGKKFNRGKLLNVGFNVAQHHHVDWFVFHDVDLLPAREIWELYSRYPRYPIHIGKLFTRYNHNPEYFGGVVSMNELHFRAINGFPNTFFGWGGEDECSLFRLNVYRFYDAARDLVGKYLRKPNAGRFLHDAEGFENMEKKKSELDATEERSMIKFELKKRETRANFFLVDGLTSLVFSLEDEVQHRAVDKGNYCWISTYKVNIAQSLFAPYDCSAGTEGESRPMQEEEEKQQQYDEVVAANTEANANTNAEAGFRQEMQVSGTEFQQSGENSQALLPPPPLLLPPPPPTMSPGEPITLSLPMEISPPTTPRAQTPSGLPLTPLSGLAMPPLLQPQ